MECRIGALLGFSVAEVRDMPLSEYSQWQRYWDEEPWGPWRDNLHAALIARKVHNMLRGKNSPAASIDEFMLTDKDTHQTKQKRSFIDWLKSVGTKRGDRSGKTSRKARSADGAV